MRIVRRVLCRFGLFSLSLEGRVYEMMARSWKGPIEETEGTVIVDTTGSFDETYANARNALIRIGL